MMHYPPWTSLLERQTLELAEAWMYQLFLAGTKKKFVGVCYLLPSKCDSDWFRKFVIKRNQAVVNNARFSCASFSVQKMLTLLHGICCGIVLCLYGVKSGGAFKVPKPTETQAKWLDYEVGAIVHFNMQTFNRYMKPGKRVILWGRDAKGN